MRTYEVRLKDGTTSRITADSVSACKDSGCLLFEVKGAGKAAKAHTAAWVNIENMAVCMDVTPAEEPKGA